MDWGDHHQHRHQFLMPPPVMPMMDEKFLGGGGGGGATPGRGAAGERKGRFTEEQIRSLESMFHAHHAKLEPREKAELARELGLQPRQVAIWFQNKRARWRSKQLEHDYAALRAKYDDLQARVESIKQEKLALIAKLHKLNGRLREWEEGGGNGGSATTTASSSSCNGRGEELYDDKRYVVGCVNINPPPESCVLGETTCATPADISIESECDDYLDYDGGFPQSFCVTPELWELWPLVEWNAVA